ncbi:putative metalloprotease CJM1_0395 family protein [Uliginosibacterium sp. H1]|uniref:putative metalloprotease CJM1_0395 family protein n=1 Tax=Uliginosibacterium sp. H1 TaxID=3114757 RepID=UPI002E173EEB|nr:putative metalloprotease CJM1_0395 family protein [Uliginosibacterium sp. H1]
MPAADSGVRARQQGGAQATESQEADAALRELRQTDAAVRRHEQAHLAAAGGIALGAAGFSYERGPDGRLYAVGGEVSIDTSLEATPEATLAKAQQIRTAALAPADPSAQDLAVAAMASRMEMDARLEMARATEASQGESTEARAASAQVAAVEDNSPSVRENVDAVAAYQAVQDVTEVTRSLMSAFA